MLIKRQNSELQKLNSEKDQFITILAHDLRSPINAILGLLDLLSTNIHVFHIGKIEKYLDKVNNSAKATYKLLEDVLLWIRANSGKIPYEHCMSGFANIYQDMVINNYLAAKNKDLSINCLTS